MSKRKIQFISKTHRGLRGKTVTVNIDRPILKLRQSHIKTDLGYFDVTVSLDRRGRLNAVLIEKARGIL